MHGSNSGQANGTSSSPQTTLEQQEYAKKVAEAEAKAKAHQEYLKNDLPKSSPLRVPESATIKEEQKQGYDQVKYSWQRGEYKYLSRWHTRTPNAPKNKVIPGLLKGEYQELEMGLMLGKRRQRFWLEERLVEKIFGLIKRFGMMLYMREGMEPVLKNRRRC